MQRNIVITCPKCGEPFPNKIGNVEIKNTDELLGFTCSSCNSVMTDEDISIIDGVVKRAVKKFKEDVINSALKKTKFKFK